MFIYLCACFLISFIYFVILFFLTSFFFFNFLFFFFFFFFFQAEDGIRDGHVTGVQTCALPISSRDAAALRFSSANSLASASACDRASVRRVVEPAICSASRAFSSSTVAARRSISVIELRSSPKIGRASCRERV